MADLIIMPSLALIAAQYTFQLFGLRQPREQRLGDLALGIVFIMAMTWICVVGIELSARTQMILLAHRARRARAVQRGRAVQGVRRQHPRVGPPVAARG